MSQDPRIDQYEIQQLWTPSKPNDDHKTWQDKENEKEENQKDVEKH